MRGNSQVRFLGGRVGAIPPGYPALSRDSKDTLDFDQRAAYPATRPSSVASRWLLAPLTNFPLPVSSGFLDRFIF
jgi:hypothetical protein